MKNVLNKTWFSEIMKIDFPTIISKIQSKKMRAYEFDISHITYIQYNCLNMGSAT